MAIAAKILVIQLFGPGERLDIHVGQSPTDALSVELTLI